MSLLRLLSGLLAVAIVAAAPSPALAEASDIAAAARGVVRVVIAGQDGDEIFPVSHGTGFSVGGERIVTNAHVVAEAANDDSLAIGIVPPEGGNAVYARLVSISVRNDLALLETTKAMNLPPLTIAGIPATSGAVTAIGYPMNVDRAQGLEAADIFRAVPPVTSTGFLSGRRPSREFDTLLHTAPIARGNSGGPLVDDCGRLIGVNSFGAESRGAEAEFFFAISTRELLPFLRANDVKPRINSSPCRSIAELDAAETARIERAQAEAEALAAQEEEALSRRSDDLRQTFLYEVIETRSNLTALALLLLMTAMGSATFAFFAHARGEMRSRAIGGAAAASLLAGALIAWFARPAFAEVEERVEEALRGEMQGQGVGQIEPVIAEGAALICVLDSERSRTVSMPEEDIQLQWASDGCVNGRTQYGLESGQWTRVFVPASEAAVSINRFDPEAREYIVERYLLSREEMTAAREARAAYEVPQCGAGQEAAGTLGNAQSALTGSLPQQPNERLVYRCRDDEAEE